MELPYCTGRHLERSAMAILEDSGPVYVVPLSLLPSLLPQIPPQVRLEPAKELCSDGGRWKQWPKDPSDMSEHEDTVFKALPVLFTCIIKSFNSNPRCELINNPSKALNSERSNNSKPDGYFLRNPASFATEKKELDEKSTGDFWEDIAVPFEYKKHSRTEDRNDNERKIIWSMHHILRNDPCRRFTFGITIEDTQMKVWSCNHAATYVSESFNFIQDQDTLIHLVAAMSLSDPSTLGWDTSLRRVRDGDAMFYEIDVPTDDDGGIETFVADKIISDFGAEAMQGRGTRVFRAKRKNGLGPTVVVKSGWQDQDRRMEGDILEDILSSMRAHPDIDYEADKKLFLTTVCHGYVHIDGQLDHTLHLIMRGMALPPDCATMRILLPDEVPQTKRHGLHRGSVGDIPHVGIKSHTNINIGSTRTTASEVCHRIQYRIVFLEMGEPVHNMFNLKQIFKALTDATRALKDMYICGYVHRDVSAGNILYFEGHGMLADFEYAKRPSDDSQHDVRTGTLYFISAEVQEQDYLFPGDQWDDTTVFKHNALHDLESLWWVAVWGLFTRSMEDSSKSYDPEKQRRVCSTFFPADFGTTERIKVLLSPKLFRKPSKALPRGFKTAPSSIQTALTRIVDLYKLAEEGPAIDDGAFTEAHDIINRLLAEATDGCPGTVISLDDVQLESEQRPAKRTRVA